MNIAVTGSSGFLGKSILKNLGDKHRISSFERKKMDLFNPATVKYFFQKKDAVVHLAGVNKNGKIKDIINVNILGTKRLLDSMCRFCPDARLIFASSFCAYDENDIFGLSKLAAEELIKDYVSCGLLKKAVILRFSNIYGPGCLPFKNSAVSTFAYQMKNGKEVMINGTGEQKRDFLFIDDAVSAIEKALNLNIKKGLKIFDVSSKKLTSLNQIIKIMQGLSRKKTAIRYNGQHQDVKAPVKKHKDAKELPGWKALTPLNKGLERLMNEN